MKVCNKYSILLLFNVLTLGLMAQQKATVHGVIRTEAGMLLHDAGILIVGENKGVYANLEGKYLLHISANKEVKLRISHNGYSSQTIIVNLKDHEIKEQNFILKIKDENMTTFELIETIDEDFGMPSFDSKKVKTIPTPNVSVESMLQFIAPVNMKSELSSQYSVRGGNFDENLIYVNDVEIYRPTLVRSGQQEGLSFVNPDLVEEVKFSAGGFDAKYGDKLSSVMDVTYTQPDSFAGSAMISLLGGSFHLQDKFNKFSYLIGARYKSNKYLLNSLETKGGYYPSYADVQAFLTYEVSEKFQLEFFGYFSSNSYEFYPEERETRFGSLNEAYQLEVNYSGKEIDSYKLFSGTLTGKWKSNKYTEMRFIASAFQSNESETFDIIGQYYLGQIETNSSQEGFGEVVGYVGTGTFLNHARNYLDIQVASFEYKGIYEKGTLKLDWGAAAKIEYISDQMREWEVLDSSGYFMPHANDNVGYENPGGNPHSGIVINEFYNTLYDTLNFIYTGYTQAKWKIENKSKDLFEITAGVRANYHSFTQQLLISPRASVLVTPKWKKEYRFRFATGLYQQQPFFKEYRYFDGTINRDIKAQSSVHLIAGMEYKFDIWSRKFNFTSELYYKYMYNVIPYELDQSRIRYYAENNAKAFATGLDLKLNGEFVKNVESWVNLSLMKTMEDIDGDFYYNYYNVVGELIGDEGVVDLTPVDSSVVYPGYIPRPTDQPVTVTIFFQDYIPNHDELKVHLMLVYGTGLPTGPPDYLRYNDVGRLPDYKRVDIGFSWRLKGEDTKFKNPELLKQFNDIWLSVEVFNLLDIGNTISYEWITDMSGNLYHVPNKLTPRLFNLKLHCGF